MRETNTRLRLTPILAPAVFAGALIGIWYIAYHYLFSEQYQQILPLPHSIWQESFANGETRNRLWQALLNTAELSLTGLILAILIGCLLAVLMNLSIPAEKSLYPWAVVLQTVPILALIPLVDVWFNQIDPWFFWFDADYKKRLIICILIALFPIITNTFFGLKSVDRNLHDLLTLHRASRLKRLWKLEIPAALPATFAGFRIAAGLSVIGAIVAEFFIGKGNPDIGPAVARWLENRGLPTLGLGSRPSIGTEINRYRGIGEYENLLATIFVSSMLGIVVFGLFGFIAHRLTRKWHTSASHS